jgi:hypothetical protein
MTSRTGSVLERFPLHLSLTDPGKRFGAVVDAVAADLDVVTRQIGDVRVAHRIGEAQARADVLKLAALHRIGSECLSIVTSRLQALGDAGADDALDTAALAAAMSDLVDLSATTLVELADALAAATPGTTSRERLGVVATAPARHRRRLASERAIVLGVIAAHSVGNATPRALLDAAATYLGLEIGEVVHSADRWWHIAHCRDALTLVAPPRPPTPAGAPPLGDLPDLTPTGDVLALEENPFRTADVEPAPKRHAQRFRVLRGGLEDVDVSVRVVGLGDRTVRPMVVALDAGRGLVFEGDVPDGVELVFAATGKVSLGAGDVTGSAWAFAGGLFADDTARLPGIDFVFGGEPLPDPPTGRTATFAITTPVADAFDSTSSLPHGAAAVGALPLPVGESRWVAFVRLAHAGGAGATAAIPRIDAGRFDGSVFADATTTNSLSITEPSLSVGFAWDEREPFAVRVLVPQRFSTLDSDDGRQLREPLRLLLDRHRAAGISLRVEYADPRWTLGTGVLRTTEDDPLGVIFAGTELWAPDTDQGDDT